MQLRFAYSTIFQKELCDHVQKRHHLVNNQDSSTSNAKATDLTVKKGNNAEVVKHLKETTFFLVEGLEGGVYFQCKRKMKEKERKRKKLGEWKGRN